MNGLLIATMLFAGGSTAAMQNEGINQAVNETANKVVYQVKNMFNGNQVDNLRENGFSYPSEEFLSSLTEEQAFEIISTIDVINSTYDWTNMTDEEILDALEVIKTEMSNLYAELGIEAPATQTRTQKRTRKGKKWNEDFVPNYNQSPDETTDTEKTV